MSNTVSNIESINYNSQRIPYSFARSKLLFFGWLILAVSCYYRFDLPLASYLHYSLQQYPKFYNLLQIITTIGNAKWFFAVITMIIAISILLKRQKLLQNSLLVLYSVLSPALICDGLKIIFGRARPSRYFAKHLYGMHYLQFKANMWSFPSGHTTTICALGFSLCLLFPRNRILFIAIALIISSTRILITAHYFSDVITGMYLALLTISLSYNYFTQLANSNAQALIRLMPAVNKD